MRLSLTRQRLFQKLLRGYKGTGKTQWREWREDEKNLSGELMVECLKVDQVSWYQCQTAVSLLWIIKTNHKTLQMAHKCCRQPCDMPPWHRRRRRTFISWRTWKENRKNKRDLLKMGRALNEKSWLVTEACKWATRSLAESYKCSESKFIAVTLWPKKL